MTIRPDATGATWQEQCRQYVGAVACCQALRATLLAVARTMKQWSKAQSQQHRRANHLLKGGYGAVYWSG